MIRRFGISLAAAVLPAFVMAAPMGVDGTIGSEWSGVTATHIGVDPAAPEGNFGSPGTVNRQTSYDIYLRRDANYVYAALKTDSNGVNSNVFANLYFAVYSGSSLKSIGFETTNNLAFNPSNAPTTVPTGSLLTWAKSEGTDADPNVIEVAIDLSVFTSNALGVQDFTFGPGDTPLGAVLFESQSFGYSVVGSLDPTGAGALGQVSLTAVPEPGSLALLGLGLAGLVAIRKRKA